MNAAHLAASKCIYVPEEVRASLPWNVERELVENLAMVHDTDCVRFVDARNGEQVAILTREQQADLSVDAWAHVLGQLAHKGVPNAAETLRDALEQHGAI